jgi:hypothetical protein
MSVSGHRERQYKPEMRSFCRIYPEPGMTATISPEIVQLAFGLGNLIFARWLAIQGLSGHATTEGMEMISQKGMFSRMRRASAVALVAALALTAVEPSTAFAGSATSSKGITASAGTSGATDISARRYYRGGGGGAAAAAAFAGIVGTGIAIAATQNRYNNGYGYGYGYGGGYYDAPPAYYGGGPVYYGGGPYYGGYRHSGVPHYRGHPLASW